MLKNYLLTAFKRLITDRFYSLINIAGLALGFAAVTLIGLYVFYEMSYNRWLPDYDKIYKVEFTETEPGHAPNASAISPALLAGALKKDFSDIEYAVRVKKKPFTILLGQEQFNETISFVDTGFFNVFDLPFVLGDRNSVVRDNKNIAISERLAKKYFGEKSPIGEVLSLSGGVDQVVTAVFKDIPQNSHFDLDLIALLDPLRYGKNFLPLRWGSNRVHTYIKASSAFDPDILQREGRAFAERNISLTWTKLPPADLHHYNAIPIADIHLYSQMDDHEKPISTINTVVTFSIIAMLILILAGINFTNLSIAQTIKRGREVGVRKVHGASRKQLITQFLIEAMMTTFIAMIAGLAIVELALPTYSGFLGKELTLEIFGSPLIGLGVLGTVMLTGLASGMYPAFVLSGYSPSAILGSSKSSFNGTPWFRNALVVFQFAVSIALMAATSVIYMQNDYIQDTDLGFKTEGKVSIPVWETGAKATALALKSEISRIPGINSVGMTTAHIPLTDAPLGVFIPPLGNRDEARSISVTFIDTDFFNTLEQKALAGRLFSAERRVDYPSKPNESGEALTRGAVLNEAAIKSLGFVSNTDAVGQIVTIPGNKRDTHVTIVGVVPNIHLESLYKEIRPMVFFVSDSLLEFMIIDFDPAMRDQALSEVKRVWQSITPDVSLKVTYLADAYEEIYRESNRQATLFAAFSLFAIFIACLGLYGLAAHMAERRTKEIGIRKVLGARVRDIVLLLTWQFTKLVLLAAPIGVAISALSMNDWLDNFAYRISLVSNSWVFIIAVTVAFAIAWLTVGGHATRIAKLSPIKALRYE